MEDSCCAVPSAGCDTCELPAPRVRRTARRSQACPNCGKAGKAVEGQTVKAMLSVTLRDFQNTEYFFCRTPTCPVVYFSADGGQTFDQTQVRERIYQKEPQTDDVLICYCFRHTAGEVRRASKEQRFAILDDINAGIQADQCACDLRNPQASCCLGNVRALLKELEASDRATDPGFAQGSN